jgi:hypothetical protein
MIRIGLVTVVGVVPGVNGVCLAHYGEEGRPVKSL